MTNASGYDPDFLPLPVPLPVPPGTVRLDYTHFTVLLNPQRRLAGATAVNIDGAGLLDIERGDDWHFDARLPESQQAGPAIYAANDLDRGHLVRRRDPVWGERGAAAAANFDTFSFTNAAPQVNVFNQAKELWAGLEDYVLDYARATHRRLSVFTGPVFAPDDPVYRGVGIPLLFWKIAAWVADPAEGAGSEASPGIDLSAAAGDAPVTEVLAATGYVLDQSPLLGRLELEERRARAGSAGDPPPLGEYRTYQVPIRDIAALAGVQIDALIAADRLAPVPAAVSLPGTGPGAPFDSSQAGWKLLSAPEEIEL